MTPSRPVVFLQNGRILTSSREVAEAFGVPHSLIMNCVTVSACRPRCSGFYVRRAGRFDMTREGFEAVCQWFRVGSAGQRQRFRQAFDTMGAVAEGGLAELSRQICSDGISCRPDETSARPAKGAG